MGLDSGIDMSATIVRLDIFPLGVCGATYLAAGLWSRSEKVQTAGNIFQFP